LPKSSAEKVCLWAVRQLRIKQSRGAVSRLGSIGAIREFQFPQSTDLHVRVKRSPIISGGGHLDQVGTVLSPSGSPGQARR
jgi:hypothetical protein